MIEIDVGPNLVTFGTFILSWHGFFSFIAVASAVFLVGRWAPARGIDPDDIYSLAIWAIIGGVIGARIVHVIDQWSFYQGNLIQIAYIWSGGIALWGGLLGGFLGGAAYAFWRKHPLGIIADLTAPALLYVQSIGRLGDIVNGEHCANATEKFFGFVWTNQVSDARICQNLNGVGDSVMPVIAMEIIWNLLALMLIWRLRNRIRPDGMLFALYLALYATGRFMVTFLREDRVWALGLQEAQYIAILVFVITVSLLIIKARPVSKLATEGGPSEDGATAPRLRGTRAERRRRDRRR
ncbi:MAG: prolipoprotein diacylglyceryl transferase [Chloroflexi bacterium]|nr:prolipoprotein diacylglyceryl transferase [Chloroflexota bacterium]